MYCFQRGAAAGEPAVNLFGSGAVMTEVLEAAKLIEQEGHAVNVWSVTSYVELMREALDAERASLLEQDNRRPWIQRLLEGERGVFVAASDYMKALPLSIQRWIPGPYVVLGTDGFGLSEARAELRDHFEVSARWIAYAALAALGRANLTGSDRAVQFAARHGLDLAKPNPRLF
jgi:pyruvate dehydrogenase E1 component